MRTQSICLALAIVLICPRSSAQWVQTNFPDSLTVTCLAASGTRLFAGTQGNGLFLSTDNGTSWTAVNNGLPKALSAVTALVVSGTNLFAATSGGVFLSTNKGTNWTAVNNGLSQTWVAALAVSGTNLFLGTGEGIFLSTDNGTNWTAANNGLPKGSGWDSTHHVYITCFASSGQNLFAATGPNPGAGDSGGVFLSTNSGSSWTKKTTGLQDSYGGIGAIVVSGTNIFAGTIRGIFLSTDNGTSWSGTSPSLNRTYVPAFAVFGTNIVAGTGYYLKADVPSGVFLSTNSGGSWNAVNDGWPEGPVWYPFQFAGVRCFALIGQNLFAGTDAGVWRRPLSEIVTSVEKLSTDVPTHFSLEQNYPNPFNPSTNISFGVPSKAFVSLKVFDALGREVSRLVAEELAAGSHSRQWNAANVPSGVYFYRLQAGTYTETKKMILLR